MTSGNSLPPPPLDVLGVSVNPIVRSDLLTLLATWARAPDGPRRMHYVTGHTLNLAVEDPGYAQLLGTADVVIAEGFGARLAAWLAGEGAPEQLPTIEWIDDLLADVASWQGSVYLVGDEPGVSDACASLMADHHPGLRVVGTDHGYFDRTGPENDALVAKIQRARPDVLMVGLPNPVQERWIAHHYEQLNTNLVLPLGAMFRWYSGIESRAPRWMVRSRLEWLHRFMSHPRRHARRYLRGNPLLVGRALGQRWRKTNR